MPSPRSLRALLTARRGATALEFAILSFPFWMFFLFLVELGLDYYTQLALDYAVQIGARKLQTGAGNAAASAAIFKADCLCPAVSAFLSCNQITLNVHPLTTTDYYLNSVAGGGAMPVVGGSLAVSGWSFAPGGASAPMFLQAVYTSIPAISGFLPGLTARYNGVAVHVTTASIGFINEPFSTSPTVCGI